MFSIRSRKPRVFVGLFEIAGYYANLRTGLESLGCKVGMVGVTPHPFGYEEPPRGWLGNLIFWHFRRVFGHEAWPAWMTPWQKRAIGFLVVWLAALRFDVFVFSYGLSFADDPDGPGLKPLRKLGRKTVFIFNGSDSRAPYCDRTGYFIEGKHTPAQKLVKLTQEKHDRLRRVHEAADLVIDYPLSNHFHRRRYVDFIRLGIPTVVPDPATLPPPPGEGVPGRPIRILHCPSETGIKGSAEIRRIVSRLKTEGRDIDFLELRGVTNARVMEELRRTDIVIDQLYSDTPMAGFAREAAQLGRPVIVAGYAWHDLKTCLPEEAWPPSIICHPDEVEECLRRFLDAGPSEWAAAGRRGYDFLRDRWTARLCAERFLQAVHEPEKCDFWVDPLACRYVWGCGMHAAEIIEAAQIVMRVAGPGGFCLDEKPDLLALTRTLGSMDLMDANLPADAELMKLDENTRSIVLSLAERNAALQTRQAGMVEPEEHEAATRGLTAANAEIADLKTRLESANAKLEDFRSMIKRRDERIAKLEGKKKPAKS